MPLDPERWRTIDPILDTALDLPPEARAAYLDRACADDPPLRREVEALLAACEQAVHLFENPPLLVAEELFPDAQRNEVSLLPGTLIGHWRVIRELGQGGMGTVYLAERADGAFEKRAALKLVRRGTNADEIAHRFRRERQILARLQHPNIAGLLDGGVTDDGMPYFVMELASGPPIDQYCDARLYTIADRLHMFREICDAVQHAHRNLVVHRDIKPGNILVVDGQIKLLDFGIAGLLATVGEGAGSVTHTGGHRLTPQYAAPEQIMGDATTTATDVYALGVVLYELLCGQPPYRIPGRTPAEIQRVVFTQQPEPPSAMVARDPEAARSIARARATQPDRLVRQVRGDLDAICLKALHKEPLRRYESAAALAEDIQRHLTGLPIMARPHSRAYRIDRFVRRNRGLVSFMTLLGSVLLVALLAILWQADAATRQRFAREQEGDGAAMARDVLVHALSRLDAAPGSPAISADTLIGIGLAHLDSLDPMPHVRAVVLNALGRVALDNGRVARADSLFREARRLLLPFGEHAALAASMDGIGRVWTHRSRYDSARVWLDGALQLRRRVLATDDPRIAESRAALAAALFGEAGSESRPARRDSLLAEAERLYDQALRVPGLPDGMRVRLQQSRDEVRLARARSGATSPR